MVPYGFQDAGKNRTQGQGQRALVPLRDVVQEMPVAEGQCPSPGSALRRSVVLVPRTEETRFRRIADTHL